jgi:AbrB family looped-hinge helix DNA binding protein
MSLEVKLTPSGRISIPADVRRRLGLRPGASVYLDEMADGLVIRTAEQAVARAQAISRKLLEGAKGATVDDFLHERREWQE